jgi:hemerythrin-like domain-containing protein
MSSTTARRTFLGTSTIAATGLLLVGCNKTSGKTNSDSSEKKNEDKSEIEVTAAEDLMREHGVLRRALLVYFAAAAKLRNNAAVVDPQSLQKTANLFRTFGEDYHERKLEEAYIFPAVKKAGGSAGELADVLLTQHQRGREITDYILGVSSGSKIGASNNVPLAQSLEAFVLMYQHHTAREDTIVFPAWKKTLTPAAYDEMNDKFEDIEHEQFGKDGFEDAVNQITAIEESLGISDLAQFTAPIAPPG